MSETHPEIAAVLAGESDGCIITGDCLEVMAGMPDSSVDCIITDVPYNCSQKSNGLRRLDYGAWDKGFRYKPAVIAMRRVLRCSMAVWCGETQLSGILLMLRQGHCFLNSPNPPPLQRNSYHCLQRHPPKRHRQKV